MDQNSQNNVLINNSKTKNHLSYLNFNASFEFLGQFTVRYMYNFSKKVLIILRQSTKHAYCWLGVQYPLNSLFSTIYLLDSPLDRDKPKS